MKVSRCGHNVEEAGNRRFPMPDDGLRDARLAAEFHEEKR
jgi:hypothetical protein